MLFAFMILTLFIIALLGWYLQKVSCDISQIDWGGKTMNAYDLVLSTLKLPIPSFDFWKLSALSLMKG
ncbi:hypothetical protein [Shewanella colwelliana]|uniref:hypothetical protein n=1 Tax=Shewanella colwelliana TaxID=23 RepID=UPI0037368D91